MLRCVPFCLAAEQSKKEEYEFLNPCWTIIYATDWWSGPFIDWFISYKVDRLYIEWSMDSLSAVLQDGWIEVINLSAFYVERNWFVAETHW